MTYDQALEQVQHAIYGKDVREAIAYLFASTKFSNTKFADPTLDRDSVNAIQNRAVWEEFQKIYGKIEELNAKLDDIKENQPGSGTQAILDKAILDKTLLG